MEWLKARKPALAVRPLDKSMCEALFSEEMSVGTQSGAPLENESLVVSLTRSKHVAVFLDRAGDLLVRDKFHSIYMKDAYDNIIGYDVNDEEEKEALKNNPDYIWLSDNFVLKLYTEVCEARFVLPANPYPEMEENTGARNTIIMFPCPSTVRMAIQMCGMDFTMDTPMVIISYDE